MYINAHRYIVQKYDHIIESLSVWVIADDYNFKVTEINFEIDKHHCGVKSSSRLLINGRY